MQDGRRLSHHRLAIDLFLEYTGFLYEGNLLGRILDCDENSVKVKRLRYKIKSSLLDTLHSCSDVTMAGNHHNGCINSQLYHFIQNLDAIHTRHLDIAEYDTIFLFVDHLKSHRSIFGCIHLIALVHKNLLQGVPDRSFVINNKNSHTILFRELRRVNPYANMEFFGSLSNILYFCSIY